MSEYFSIRHDKQCSRGIASWRLVDFIARSRRFERSGPAEFRTTDPAWLVLSLVRADKYGNFSSDGSLAPTVNLVAVVAGDDWTREALADVLGRIVRDLGWEAVEDHTGAVLVERK